MFPDAQQSSDDIRTRLRGSKQEARIAIDMLLPIRKQPARQHSIPIVTEKTIIPKKFELNLDLPLVSKSLNRPRRLIRKKSKLVNAFFIIGAAAFSFSVYAGIATILNNSKVQKQAHSVLGVTTSNDQTANDIVSEQSLTLSDFSSYTAAPGRPRYIRIPKIAVETRVLPEGVNKNGAIATPNNISDTGWYNGSAAPGDAGSALIVGHVAGPTTHGVFWNLNKLVVGDVITVEMGSGKLVTYNVAKSLKVPASAIDMGKYLSPDVVGKDDLKLMTCSGPFDKASSNYRDRLIVIATKNNK